MARPAELMGYAMTSCCEEVSTISTSIDWGTHFGMWLVPNVTQAAMIEPKYHVVL